MVRKYGAKTLDHVEEILRDTRKSRGVTAIDPDGKLIGVELLWSPAYDKRATEALDYIKRIKGDAGARHYAMGAAAAELEDGFALVGSNAGTVFSLRANAPQGHVQAEAVYLPTEYRRKQGVPVFSL